MKAALLQRQLKINADVLTGLYEEIAKLRAARKAYNERADEFAEMSFSFDQTLQPEKSREHSEKSVACREQAAVYTPYIRKFKKKIAAVEEVQRELKQKLKAEQSVEAWMAEESYEWDITKFAKKQLYQFNGYMDSDGNVVWEE
jgi:predicted ribosome quality control (RQC) complex YloA/Tae2 family protein